MRLTVLAVGQMRGTPEAALYNDYAARIASAGQNIGLSGPSLIELKDHAKPQAKLAAALDKIPDALIVALDESGKNWTSRDLATKLADWRDDGCRDVVFVVGPADGLDADMRRRADMTLSLGAMTWPHLLARVMLCEQLWRAVSILTGHPYHRD